MGYAESFFGIRTKAIPFLILMHSREKDDPMTMQMRTDRVGLLM